MRFLKRSRPGKATEWRTAAEAGFDPLIGTPRFWNLDVGFVTPGASLCSAPGFIPPCLRHSDSSPCLHGGIEALPLSMRTLLASYVASLLATGILVSSALGGKPAEQPSKDKKAADERTVFVTGSLIPQRIKLKRIGTTTISPIRIIDRQEIDATGRQTTRGMLVADPSVRIISH